MSAFDFQPKQSIKQQVQNKHIRYNNIHISSSGVYPLDSLSTQNEESVDLSISLPWKEKLCQQIELSAN